MFYCLAPQFQYWCCFQTIISDPTNYIAKFLSYCGYTWRAKSMCPRKICIMIFRKWEGGGSKAIWNFSKHSSVLVGRGFPIRVKGLNWKIGGSFQIEHSAVGLLLLLKRSWVFAVDLRDIGGGGEDCDYGKQQKSNCVPVHNVCTHCALHSLLLGKVHMNSQQRREFFSFLSAITNCVMFPDPRVSWGTWLAIRLAFLDWSQNALADPSE